MKNRDLSRLFNSDKAWNSDALIALRRKIWRDTPATEREEADKQFTTAVADMVVGGQEYKGRTIYNLIRECRERPERLIELTMRVVDKDKNLVPFFLNDVQRDLSNKIHEAIIDYNAGRRNHLKFLILKGRQQGFTTFVSAYILARTILNANTECLTLADCENNTTDIFAKKAKNPFMWLPDNIKPEIKYNTRRELTFQNEKGDGLNSSWQVATATPAIGRSKTLNIFHGSEVAFWDSAEEILMAGLKQALTKDCIMFLESTANGNNYYKNLWDSDNNYECLFFEWWRTSEYRMGFESRKTEKEFKKTVLGAEDKGADDAKTLSWSLSRCKWLYKHIGLDWNQIYWYYNQWKDSREKVKQEYPCTAKEAFLASGNRYFNVENVERRLTVLNKQYEKEHPARGYFKFKRKYDPDFDRMVIDKKTIELIDDDAGIIEFYKEPEPGKKYALGGDSAGDGSDWNTGEVIDIDRNQVAELACQFDEDLYAEQMICLGYHYNTAMAAIETNFSTHPLKVMIYNGYPNLYIREQADDSIAGNMQNKYGWVTSSKTRPTMFAEVRTIVRDTIDKINGLRLLDEMTTVIKNDRGRPDHEEGKHDDRVVAYCIACQVIYQVIEPIDHSGSTKSVKGYYTVDELEDLGYTELEIEEYMENMKAFDQVTILVENGEKKEYHGIVGDSYEPEYVDELMAEDFDNAEGW